MQGGQHDAFVTRGASGWPDHHLAGDLLGRPHGDRLVWVSCATLAAGSALNLLLAGLFAG